MGAAAGALIADDSAQGALIGGAAGGLIGAGIGAILQRQKRDFDRIDQLETEVRQQQIQQQQAQSASEAKSQEILTLKLQSEVLFGKGSSVLTAGGTQKVGEIAQVLREYPDSNVIIKGYTSSDGDEESNLRLSERRAEMVQNQLVASGVRPARLTAIGFGESSPVAPNDTEAGRVQNRRVEIDVVPTA